MSTRTDAGPAGGDDDGLRASLDAVLDHGRDDASLRRLDAMLAAPGREATLEYLNLVQVDTGLTRAIRDEPIAARLSRLLDDGRPSSRRSPRRRNLAGLYGAFAAACCVFAVVTFTAIRFAPPQPVAGTVVSVSDDIAWAGEAIMPGSLVRVGRPLELIAGAATLKTPRGVLVRLGDMARGKFAAVGQLRLDDGSLMAHVTASGQGFTVTTPDAVVVDHGTRFRVTVEPDLGTTVTVDEGRVTARLSGSDAAADRIFELTDGRSARLNRTAVDVDEVDTLPEWVDAFATLPTPGAGLRSISGNLRLFADPPASMLFEERQTDGHAAVLAEREGVTLGEDLTVAADTAGGSTVLPAGTVVDTFLVHWDPPAETSRGAIGALLFARPVLGVIADGTILNATDAALGHERTRYETDPRRGYEGHDGWSIASDRRSVSIHPGMSHQDFPIDELRVLVLSDSADEPSATAE